MMNQRIVTWRRRAIAITVAILMTLTVWSGLPTVTDNTAVPVYAAGEQPSVSYGYTYAEDKAGYLHFDYNRTSKGVTTSATIADGAFEEGVTADDIDADLPSGLELKKVEKTAESELEFTFDYTRKHLLFEGTSYDPSDSRQIGILDIIIKPEAITDYTGEAVDVPIVAEVTKKNQIPYGARLFRELTDKRGGLTGAVYDFTKDIDSSVYWPHPDFYELGGKVNDNVGGVLDILPNYKTTQQPTGYSCGLDAALTVVEHFGLRKDVSTTDGSVDLNSQDLSKLRGSGREWGGATSQKEMENVFKGLGSKFNQNWNYISAFDLVNTKVDDVHDLSLPDVNVIDGELRGNKYDLPLFKAIPWWVRHGVPIIVGWNGWGGHYQTIIGYDDLGTEDLNDDVIILADSYDSVDHLEDGYVTKSYKRFIDDWSVGSWGNDLGHYVFLAAWPDSYNPVTGSNEDTGVKLPVKSKNTVTEANTIPHDAAYDSKLESQLEELGTDAVPVASDDEDTNHSGSPYFTLDNGKIKSKSRHTVSDLSKFQTYQESALGLDGPAALLTALNYYNPKSVKGLTDIDLAKLKDGSTGGKITSKSTVDDITAIIDALNAKSPDGPKWDYYTSKDYNAATDGGTWGTPTKASFRGEKISRYIYSPDSKPLFPYFIDSGYPVLTFAHEGGDSWQLAVGYDDLGTDDYTKNQWFEEDFTFEQDNVLTFADPKDVNDHNRDGFTNYSYQWLVMDWNNTVDTKYKSGAFVVVYPHGNYETQLTSVAGKKITLGGGDGSVPAKVKTSELTLPYTKTALKAADLSASAGAAVKFYADSGFGGGGSASVALTQGKTKDIYVKVVAENGFDTAYYKLTVAVTPASKIKVSFKPNGGKSLSVKSKLVLYGTAYGTLPKATRTGYKQTGWYTGATKGTKVTAKTITLPKDHTLFAQWKANKYTVKFNVTKGKKLKSSLRSKSVTYNQKYGKLPTPKKSGYKFKGWYNKKKGGKKITGSSLVKITKTTTLYAHWKKK